MRAAIALSLFVLGGCSLVLDPGRHMPATDAGVDTGSASDADLDAPDAPDVDPLLPGNVCPQMARVICEGRENCCTMETPDDCQTLIRESCLEFVGPIVNEPSVGYDPVRGALLLERAQASAEACDNRILNLLADRDGLLSTFRGTVAADDPCVTSESLPILLRPFARIFSCTTGNYCHDDGVSFTCAPLKGAGEVCGGNYECGDDLYCARVTTSESQCSLREDDGTACTGPVQCESLYCDEMSNECETPEVNDVWCPDPFGLLLPNPPSM